MDANNVIQARILVKGRVQGVGFRAYVEQCAQQIGDITGWVRNVGWAGVECVAEGEREKVERLIGLIKKGPSLSRVDEASVEYSGASGEFTAFSVKRSLPFS
ncbi:MAG: acylphosphatase [Anaerolineales bacterium]|nr:acylphosphatase [Anaerolineales bacterium]